MALVCTGCNCPKNEECGRCLYNLNSKYYAEVNTIENLANFGSCIIDSTGFHDIYHYCGPNGNYKMFEQFELKKELSITGNCGEEE